MDCTDRKVHEHVTRCEIHVCPGLTVPSMARFFNTPTRLKAPPAETPIPWLPRGTERFSDSTPDLLAARYHRAQLQVNQLVAGQAAGAAQGTTTTLGGRLQQAYMRAKYTSVTNKSCDDCLIKLLEMVEDVELEAATAKLLAQNEEHDRLALHHTFTAISHGKWLLPASRGDEKKRGMRTHRVRTEARAPAHRRLEEPPTPPGVPFLPPSAVCRDVDRAAADEYEIIILEATAVPE